ncbi:aldose 1-epimerase [Ralstonia pickettii]|uniref:Aldose 1-epimerase n=1 Tax=Ralstonia pickettii TaxID=329 RepID=A0A7X2HS03_RALPI|nr:aldose 1-epimerase [Ralstonia pickettii]MRT01561.1 aldose 1-epimerase [Ralstonia pickettii]
MPTLQLENGTLRGEVLPEAGGGLLRFDLLHDGDVAPIFRPGTAEAALHDPRALACFPLVPWSNRIGGGRFPFRGRTIEVPRTRGDEPYPLHGHGWLMPWHPVSQTATSVELAAMVDHGRPFRYLALQRYALAGNTLNIALTVRNEGSPLPFGLGVHPFFPRTPDVQLRAGATAMWQSAPDNLPTVLNAPSADADFRKLRKLDPSAAINHSFEGWDGRAEIVWPSRRVSVSITADTSRYVLYTPVAYDFFCFEPVDHAINAHNLPGLPQDHGLTILGTGQSLQRSYQFTVNRPDA